jgi:hypothetical protein
MNTDGRKTSFIHAKKRSTPCSPIVFIDAVVEGSKRDEIVITN